MSGDDILSDFTARNQTPLTLERRFNLSVDYTLVSEEEAWAGRVAPAGTPFRRSTLAR